MKHTTLEPPLAPLGADPPPRPLPLPGGPPRDPPLKPPLEPPNKIKNEINVLCVTYLELLLFPVALHDCYLVLHVLRL